MNPTLTQRNPVHYLTSYFFKIHFIIILQSMPSSPKWSFFSGFLTELVYAFFICPSHAICTRTIHLVIIGLITLTMSSEAPQCEISSILLLLLSSWVRYSSQETTHC
jgi:uncharacterized membrane protein YjjB (DUF3815 family)